MGAFTKTRAAADYICRHTSSELTGHRALKLLTQLRSCEAALAAEGDIPVAVQSLLRALALTVRELTGTGWLAVNRDDPDIAAFAALDMKPHPPPPDDLDEVLSRVLWARFATLRPQPRQRPSGHPHRREVQASPRPIQPSDPGRRPTVNHDEFVAAVRDRGEYAGQGEAEQVATWVLEVLARRLPPEEASDLAAQLPDPLAKAVQRREDQPADTSGVEEFLRQVAERIGARPGTAEWDASAVLSTLADAVSRGQLNQLLSLLPSGYAPMFGKPEPA
jgi:uncharacterized protein (DUF2267 family)